MKLLLLSVLLALSGCAASVITSNARAVLIHAPGVASAQILADAECGRNARYARYVQPGGNYTYHFDCVL